MGKVTLDNFKEDASLLIEAGFLAVKQLDEKSAHKLFEAAQKLDPDNISPQIGIGYIHLNKLEIKEATSIFDDLVKKNPEDQLARIYLGICYMLVDSKREEGEKLVRDAMGKTDDPTWINLAKVSLDWSEKTLKDRKLSF